MALSRPSPIPFAFASSALPANINTLPNDPTGSFTASWKQGFPPVTMTPLASGGSPPVGADFNGAFKAISENAQWANAGGLPAFNSALSTNMSGYPVGAVLLLNDNVGLVVNTLAGNTNDPNSSTTGWSPFGGARVMAVAMATVTSSTSTSYTLTLPLGGSTYFNGLRAGFVVGTTNTGACTITVNGGTSVALASSTGGALQAGDLLLGDYHEAVYVASASAFRLVKPVVNQRQVSSSGTTIFTLSAIAGTELMMGLGSTITPRTGRLLIGGTLTGNADSAALSRTSLQLRFGTGTAPTGGGAVAGTATGAPVILSSAAVAEQDSASTFQVLTGLTPGTLYWLDFSAIRASGTATLTVTARNFTVVEI